LTHLITFATTVSVLFASAGVGPLADISRVIACLAAVVSMPKKASAKAMKPPASGQGDRLLRAVVPVWSNGMALLALVNELRQEGALR
jgi:hypothetical protein